MVVKLEDALANLRNIGEENKKKIKEEIKKNELFRKKTDPAYTALEKYLGVLSTDEGAKTYFATQPTLVLFEFVKNGKPHGIGYMKKGDQVYALVGDEITEGSEKFAIEINKHSDMFADENDRDTFLDGIRDGAILEKIASYSNE